jgi:hypothetical protein
MTISVTFLLRDRSIRAQPCSTHSPLLPWYARAVMGFPVTSQTTGTKRWTCSCGKVNLHRVYVGHYLVECRFCARRWVVGDAFFEVANNGGNMRGPADSGAPYQHGEPTERTDALQSDSVAMRPAVMAGKWRSGNPVTLTMPDLFADPDKLGLYRDLDTGRLWYAISFALGTRVIAQPIDGTSADRITIGRREWQNRTVQMGDPGAIRVARPRRK